MGFKSMPHEPCLFKATQFPDEPPIYLGCYVDDFTYYSISDKVEGWFEQNLAAQLRVDFMGPISWYLGQSYEWNRRADGRLSVYISQQAHIEGMLKKFDLTECIPTKTPYRSGYPIDIIPHDGIPAENKKAAIKTFQSILGGINWVAINT